MSRITSQLFAEWEGLRGPIPGKLIFHTESDSFAEIEREIVNHF